MDRTRRLRMNAAIRDLVREQHVRIDELIYPMFVIEGENICSPVDPQTVCGKNWSESGKLEYGES